MAVKIFVGDALQCLDLLADESVDSCVTDPPYHLQSIVKRFDQKGRTPSTASKCEPYQRHAKGFMGKEWDGGDIAFRPDVWREVLRVLKPGAHLLAFGGTRGFHRMFCAIEDAGFEVRDCVSWLYGSGFPKSHDAGDGWGTALKPAWEPICVARKPLIGTVADNVSEYRTGAINIDGCRVNATDGENRARPPRTPNQILGGGKGTNLTASEHNELGRWPANVIHDGSDDVLRLFPETKSGSIALHHKRTTSKTKNAYGERAAPPEEREGDSGSAARFFYCAKASKSDREDGCAGLPLKEGGMRSETSGQHVTRRDGGDPVPVHNNHPTVKPTELMRYLVRLVTPKGGVVLDPFMGSGSTGRGALLGGFSFVGIEREPEYAAIARARIAAVTE